MPLHLDIPTQQQLSALLAARATPSVSLYLPTGHLPQDAAAARIELKNLVHEAVTQIEAAGLPAGRGAASTWTICTTTRSSGRRRP